MLLTVTVIISLFIRSIIYLSVYTDMFVLQLKQQLEMERLQLKSEIDQLKDKLEDGRKKVLHQEQKVIELTHLLKTAENSAATSYEHLNKKNSSVHGLLKAKVGPISLDFDHLSFGGCFIVVLILFY